MAGPSKHLSWNELACVNRLGRRFADGQHAWAPGEVVQVYPQEWRDSRAVDLAVTFETIRAATGGLPIAINSAFRTIDYNRAVGSTDGSQHPAGRALDIRHPKLTPAQLHVEIIHLYTARKLPHLGGLGLYPGFVHIDVRPRGGGQRLAQW